jgi:hypothetical protein
VPRLGLAGLLLLAATSVVACVGPQNLDTPDDGGAGGSQQPPADAGTADDGGGTSCGASTLTYANFGMSFLATYCNRCHAFTQHAAQLEATGMIFEAGTNSYMPAAAPFPTPAQRMQLTTWLTCGAP